LHWLDGAIRDAPDESKASGSCNEHLFEHGQR